MGLHLRCPTDEAILLAGHAVPGEPWRFFSISAELPGVRIPVKPLEPLEEQLLKGFAKELGIATFNCRLSVRTDYTGRLPLTNGQEVTLYIAKVQLDEPDRCSGWQTLPALLRAMPKSKLRVPYMLAMQVLAEGVTDTITAVESDEIPI